RLARFQPGWVGVGVFFFMGPRAFFSARGGKNSTACGASLGYGPGFELSFIWAFFYQGLSFTICGGGARVWLFLRKGAGVGRATYSVLIDRIVGVLVLALIVIVCLPWSIKLINDQIARTVLLVIGFGAIVGGAIFLLIGTRFWRWLDRWPPTRHLSVASRIAATLCRSPSSIGYVIACSITIHLITIVSAWCCIMAIAAPVSLARVLILFPPVLLVST